MYRPIRRLLARLNVRYWNQTHVSLILPEKEWPEWFNEFALDYSPTIDTPQDWNHGAYLDRIKIKSRPFNHSITKFLPGRGSRDYTFTNEEATSKHRPLAPISAFYMPPKLTPDEKKVVEIAELSYLLETPIKIKPSLTKKVREFRKGGRRVYWDSKGRMKEAKQKA
jgi:hypothetical protein